MVRKMSATISDDGNGNIEVKIVNSDPDLFYSKTFIVNGYNQTQSGKFEEMNGKVNGNSFTCDYEDLEVNFLNEPNDCTTKTAFTKTDSNNRVNFYANSNEYKSYVAFDQDNIRLTTEGDNSVYSIYDANTYYGKITYNPNTNSFTAETDKNKGTNYQNFAFIACAGITDNYYRKVKDKNINKAMNAILMAVTDKNYY